MKDETMRLFYKARVAVGDQAVFTEDQISKLRVMIDLIQLAVDVEVKEKKDK